MEERQQLASIIILIATDLCWKGLSEYNRYAINIIVYMHDEIVLKTCRSLDLSEFVL